MVGAEVKLSRPATSRRRGCRRQRVARIAPPFAVFAAVAPAAPAPARDFVLRVSALVAVALVPARSLRRAPGRAVGPLAEPGPLRGGWSPRGGWFDGVPNPGGRLVLARRLAALSAGSAFRLIAARRSRRGSRGPSRRTSRSRLPRSRSRFRSRSGPLRYRSCRASRCCDGRWLCAGGAEDLGPCCRCR